MSVATHARATAAPIKTHKRTYLDPEGRRVQVITEWWREAPEGMEADKDPDMPGRVVTQFVRRLDDHGAVTLNPMVRDGPPASPCCCRLLGLSASAR